MPQSKFRSFAIFGAMRSGSNLLERYINQYEGLKCHGELFNPAFVGWSGQTSYFGVNKRERDADPQKLIDAILESDQANIPGFRIFRDHNNKAIDLFLRDETYAKIVLVRDPVDSFVSLKIARKTDQWLVHDESDRKTARVFFDMAEFEAYKKTREKYSSEILKILKDSGQVFFAIQYDQLNDLQKINELAAFIGALAPRKGLEQTIKRQNPEPLWQKIVNYGEVFQALKLTKPPQDTQPVPNFVPKKGSDLSRAYFCTDHNLIFAPIPSAPDGSVQKWINGFESVAPQNGFGDDHYRAWRNNHVKPVVFTIIRHPVMRAYDVFMRKIFATGKGSFLAIRKALEIRFGVFLPGSGVDIGEIDYDLMAHRAAFKQFLVFIHHNLTQQTNLRTDGRWRRQSDLVGAYEKEFGQCHAFREEDLAMVEMYLGNRLGLDGFPPGITIQKPEWVFDLNAVYDAETESLAKIAYAKDYARFGFNNWR